MNLIENTYNLAKEVLRGNYKEHGIYAGKNHFDDYWARDGFFASLAALELKDYDIVKKNLLLFIKYQRDNGQLPLRVGNKNILLKLIGIKIKKQEKPRYKEDKEKSYSLDPNLLFIISAAHYVKKTKDKAFAKKYFENFRKALNFILTFTDGTLLVEGIFSNWEDSLRTRGHVLYTSACYYEALKSMTYLSKIMKNEALEKNYSNEMKKVKKMVNKELWNGSYFSLMYHKNKRYDYFNTSGNLLVIFFDLATKEQASSIEKHMDIHGVNDIVPSLTNHKKYPRSLIYAPYYLIHMQDYHNRQCWPWLGALNVITKSRLGMKKEAKILLDKIARVVSTYNGFYEVFDRKGNPLNRFFYKSEVNFSWSAAFFILGYKKLFQ